MADFHRGARARQEPVLAWLFDALLATVPDLPALVQNGRTTTFLGWWTDSSLIASGLAEPGVGRQDVSRKPSSPTPPC